MNEVSFLATELIMLAFASVFFLLRAYLDTKRQLESLYLPGLFSLIFASLAWICFVAVQACATWRDVLTIRDTAHKTFWIPQTGLNYNHLSINLKVNSRIFNASSN
jgi:hypothetical protein